ncbi:lipocalin family protein [Psychrobacter sp.]|uniref:lipocalin family protein n=1 Tax=Psychrobacter sp. TaxID=56811 RepID=UPI003BB08A24
MKTTKLPKSAWSDSQAAGYQSHQQASQLPKYYLNKDSASQVSNVGPASNDASYHHQEWNDELMNNMVKGTSTKTSSYGYKKAQLSTNASSTDASSTNLEMDTNTSLSMPLSTKAVEVGTVKISNNDLKKLSKNNKSKNNTSKSNNNTSAKDATLGVTEIPERIFMNGLIKHTGIALAIIIPLAAFSAYAASPPVSPPSAVATNTKTTTETLSVKPSSIIHKSANTPTTVDSVDLKKYAGTWYEIGRLPMYFQRNCASDVTATYVEKTDGSGIKVINECKAEDGSGIMAEGLAKPADNTGSKLKVTFLPSWIRWLPVGRADYWVLARDPDYQTALVGTPDKKYLWLLARSPNVNQETYAKYRQIAQQQGYDLKEFKLTSQSNQTVNLVP